MDYGKGSGSLPYVVRAVDVQVEKAVFPQKYKNKEQLAQQMTTRTWRPVNKLSMLLAVDEAPGPTADPEAGPYPDQTLDAT